MIPARATYTPQPDITTYELSKCLELSFRSFTSTIINKEEYDMMEDGVKRHFTVEDLSVTPEEPEDPAN